MEKNLTFEMEKILPVSLEVLEFVGVTDHSVMVNRDAADQHPISAVTGLETALKKVDDNTGEINSTLEKLDKVLTRHSDKLTSVDESLNEIEKTFGELDTELTERKTAFDALKEQCENVATDDEILEVLNDE